MGWVWATVGSSLPDDNATNRDATFVWEWTTPGIETPPTSGKKDSDARVSIPPPAVAPVAVVQAQRVAHKQSAVNTAK